MPTHAVSISPRTCSSDRVASLKLLLAAGADINAKDPRGLSPLHEGARWGWNDVVRFLVERGADLQAKDNRGLTPLDSALGKAGGNSRGGQRIDVHADTAALRRELMALRHVERRARRGCFRT